MTTEEFKTIVAQAESGDVSSMIRLTHIYGEKEGYLDYSKALRWYLEIIQTELNFQKQAQYDQVLLKKITDSVLSAQEESDVPVLFQKLNVQPASNRSLFGTSIYFSSSAAKNTVSAIYRIEKEVQEKERIAKIKKAAAEAEVQRAEEARKKAEANAREAEARTRLAEAEAKRAEEARRKAEVEAAAKKAEEERRKVEAEAELARLKAAEEERKVAEERRRKEVEERKRREEEELRRKEEERKEKEWRALMKQNIEEDYASGAFNPNSFLSEHLDIPDCVTKIGIRAFESCWLTSIYIPNSVKTIGGYAFANSALRCIELSAGVREIAPNAFDSCLFLEQIIVPKGSKQRLSEMDGLKDLSYLIIEE